jgi:hypothetical protein
MFALQKWGTKAVLNTHTHTLKWGIVPLQKGRLVRVDYCVVFSISFTGTCTSSLPKTFSQASLNSFPTNFSDNCDLENSLKFRFIKAWESLSGISRLELGGCQVSKKQSFFCIICVYLNVLVVCTKTH